MTSDDVTAWAAISFGGAVSVAATAAATMLLLPPRVAPAPTPNPRIEVVRLLPPPPPPPVDFAIIRSPAEVEIMVGPEGPSTKWSPPKALEMRGSPSR